MGQVRRDQAGLSMPSETKPVPAIDRRTIRLRERDEDDDDAVFRLRKLLRRRRRHREASDEGVTVVRCERRHR